MDVFIGIISCYIQISFLFKAINCMQAEKDAAYCSQYTLFLMSYAKSEFKWLINEMIYDFGMGLFSSAKKYECHLTIMCWNYTVMKTPVL